MATIQGGTVGPSLTGDGTAPQGGVRQGRDGGLAAFDLHGRFYEQTSRGLSFIATTAAAGIAPGTALTATGALMLANPVGSGVNLSINKLFFGLAVSGGTLGPGNLWWTGGANPAVLPAETTAALRNRGAFNTSNAGDAAKAYSGVSLTTVPVIIRPTVFTLDTYVGTVTSLNAPQFEEVAGELVVPPGFFIAVEGIAGAGTSPLVVLAISYENIPV